MQRQLQLIWLSEESIFGTMAFWTWESCDYSKIYLLNKCLYIYVTGRVILTCAVIPRLHAWPLNANVRWKAAVLKSGIFKRFLCLMLRSWNSNLILNLLHKYGGTRPCTHLNIMTASLTTSCCETDSHCNCSSVTWSYFFVPVKSA